jgi:hypothetical protein
MELQSSIRVPSVQYTQSPLRDHLTFLWLSKYVAYMDKLSYYPINFDVQLYFRETSKSLNVVLLLLIEMLLDLSILKKLVDVYFKKKPL